MMSPRFTTYLTALEKTLPRVATRWRAQLTTPLARPQTLPLVSTSTSRTFTNTSIAFKKGGKAAAPRQESATSSKDAASQTGSGEDPHDFSTLDAGIQKVLQKLQDDISKLRTGGRFNPELLERVLVRLDKDNKKSYNLGLLAQVIPKGGRSVVVLVGQAEHVKPIISAIQGARELNLQPQQDPHNALQLNIPIPPPTKESRDLAQAAAGKAGEIGYTGIRNARAAMQKRLRAMELGRAARPDDLRKAHKDMEKVVEKGNADVKKVVEAAKKGMENS